MKRTEFLKKGLLGVSVLPLLPVITSCSTESDPSPTPPNNNSNPPVKDCLANGTSSSIGGNHGHSITVTKTDVEAGVEKTYSIQGTASHDHQVTVTATNFADLKSNNSVQVQSTSSTGHTHSITVSCA